MFGRKTKANKLPKISTVIGKGTKIKGDVLFEGGLHVDGKVVGSITAEHDEKDTLVLSELGHIEGDIRVADAVLNGEIHGDVYASNRVELASNANIHGTVYYKYLEMMMGAEVNGQLIHVDDGAALAGKSGKTGGNKPPLATLKEANDKGEGDAASAKSVKQSGVQSMEAGRKP